MSCQQPKEPGGGQLMFFLLTGKFCVNSNPVLTLDKSERGISRIQQTWYNLVINKTGGSHGFRFTEAVRHTQALRQQNE